MPASYEPISFSDDESFHIGVFQDNIEKSTWHYHHRLELSFVTEGTGRRIVGDSIEEFYPGDLIFIGEKLPHVWIAKKNQYGSPTSRSFESVYLQFGKEILPEEILLLPELVNVSKAIKMSERGVRITGDTLNEVSRLMLRLPYLNKFDRMLYFYQIMNAIGDSDSFVFLTSEDFIKRRFTSKNKRIVKIHEYLMEHYREDIELSLIAKLVHLAPGSLCRFFKSETGETLIDYLNKIKVDYACNMLENSALSVTDVCFDCGFNNVSHFNKQFKKIKGLTPLSYRKQSITP